MGNKKQKEKTEVVTPKPNSSLLTYEEYYDTLMLAKRIRLENQEAIEKAKTPKEKIQLLESLFLSYQVPGNTPKEKEQAILLKVNIFMPDSEQFLIDYKTKFDKNIRLISEAYQIPAPFAISKVSEIGKYEKYLIRIKEEGGLKESVTIADTLAELATSGALKPLYDGSPVAVTTPKEEKNRKKAQKNIKTDKKETPKATEEAKPSTLLESTSSMISSSDSPISEELLHHINSMQRYCTRLLDQNEQLSSENDSLVRLNHELEILNRRLRQELENVGKKNATLEAQVTALTTENASLQAQITEVQETEVATRTIAEETATERDLHQQIKEMEFKNQELSAQVKEEQEKTHHYRNRAIVAEAQLDQLQSGMQGIFRQVDELDFSFTNDNPKKKS